jgi:ubiquinone/menaquinone biosynthesis C-methylase UbiE
MARIDYERASRTYDQGRALPGASRAAWQPVLTEALHRPPRRWLDVGSGTGVWAAQLGEWFSCAVVGVEPSDGMRTRAVSTRSVAGVRYVAGRAEALPLADDSCDAAWLSTVVHHVELAAAAAEVVRVTRRGGPVCIRSTFPERRYGLAVERFFPEVRRVWDTFPTVAATRTAFEAAGCTFEDLRLVPEPQTGTLAEARAGVPAMRHADTLLAGLTDDEFARGRARIDAAVAAGEAYPSGGLDLLLLRVA